MLIEMVLQTEVPPLHQDSTGAVRVGNSRVLLEMVIHAFENGSTPETIAQQYPTTTLADIYGVIAYYLRHRDEVAVYLSARESKAKEVRKRIEGQQGDLSDLRQRLLARKPARG
ncbi:MAG: hypothetical protein Fur0022_07700 [Anaerolineales bacterium]